MRKEKRMELEQFKCEVCPLKRNKWFPVSKWVPDVAGLKVIATIVNEYGQYDVREVFTGYGDNKWYCNNTEIDISAWKVIAWMPFPEPYKENKDES